MSRPYIPAIYDRPPSPLPLLPALPNLNLPPPAPKRKKKRQHPQKDVDQFWKLFVTKFPGNVTTILPNNPYARSKASKAPVGVVQAQKAIKSYDEARNECQRDVARIVKECRRVNHKYRDPHFDIELDLKLGANNCLYGLEDGGVLKPKGVKRVTEIFENPQFYIDEATSSDVVQGGDGDCWLMAALCALGNKDGLIDRICVARDQEVGVYGFVFHRDGEWQQCIIDDKLYLRAPDYEESVDERHVWNKIDRKSTEEEYTKAYQTGSRALYFAQCSDENETWLPLLEKAFAKLHGDYHAIESGFTGEAIEDLTGGVTSEIFATDILDKDRFWNEQLSKVNQDFLFGCSTGHLVAWIDPERTKEDVRGIIQKHAYGIVDAKEIKGERLVKLRNPWGTAEWTGAWSDGSKQWNGEWLELLHHEFGNDGVFWMSYKDLLKKYQHFDRTRLFDSSWTITQQWTTLHVPWSAEYHSTKFRMTLHSQSPVIIVLSQLDNRYFRDLKGQYRYTLNFRVHRDGEDEDDYIVRSHGNVAMKRSVSTDITLDAGTYFVLIKISAERIECDTPQRVIRDWAADKPEKLIQLGLSYDLAHAKGRVVETKEERQDRKEYEKKKADAEHEKRRKKAEKGKRKWYDRQKKKAARDKRQLEKADRARARRAAKSNHLAHANHALSDEGFVDGPSSRYDMGPHEQLLQTHPGRMRPRAHTEPSILPVWFETPAKTAKGLTSEPEVDVKKESQDTKTTGTPLEETMGAATSTKTTPVAAERKSWMTSGMPEMQPVPEIQGVAEPLPLSIPPTGPTAEKLAALNLGDNEDPAITAAQDDKKSIGGDSLDSFPDFEFDSDLDIPPPSLHIHELEDDELSDDNEPWNAVCVVGLRVYSEIKEANVSLEVVRPKSGDKGDKDAYKAEEVTLDRDDPNKGFVKADGAAVDQSPSQKRVAEGDSSDESSDGTDSSFPSPA